MTNIFNQNLIPTLGILIIAFVLFLAFKKPSQATNKKGSKKPQFGGFPNTPTLNTFSIDFTEQARTKKIDPVIGPVIKHAIPSNIPIINRSIGIVKNDTNINNKVLKNFIIPSIKFSELLLL